MCVCVCVCVCRCMCIILSHTPTHIHVHSKSIETCEHGYTLEYTQSLDIVLFYALKHYIAYDTHNFYYTANLINLSRGIFHGSISKHRFGDMPLLMEPLFLSAVAHRERWFCCLCGLLRHCGKSESIRV